jgi:UTP:GlnB (protein PII) uridylyltransferase
MDESTVTMPPDFLASYTDSMPNSYRQQQSAEEISEHARIVWRRGHEVVHAEIWQKRLNAVVICIVCDERPGLLVLIRATIAAHGLDVLAAQAYARKGQLGRFESVHFLWLSPKREGSNDLVGDEDIAQISASLGALLKGETDLGAVIERVSSIPSSPTRSAVEVGFASHPNDDGALLLIVEADDRPGLLMAITTALFAEKVSAVHSEVTTSGKRARGKFQILEASGEPLTQSRAAKVAEAVYAALVPTLPK